MNATDVQSTSPKPIETGHVGLNVSNLVRSKTFYQSVLGLEVLGESQTAGRKYLFLGNGADLILTLWEQSDGRFEKHKPGLHHLAFRVATIRQVEEAEQRLRAMKVHFHYDGIVPQSEGASSAGIFFEDPDGTRLEIYSPVGAGNRAAPFADAPSCGFF